MKEPTLPTAEDTLQIAYDTIKANQSSDHKDVDPVLLHAIESHTAAHTAALQEMVKELEEIIVDINSCQMVGITWPNELKQKVEKIWEAAE